MTTMVKKEKEKCQKKKQKKIKKKRFKIKVDESSTDELEDRD